ncbi:MAG: tetratricopeptide repeat protein, partial [Candidatus Sulfotelmatobacter sp.]
MLARPQWIAAVVLLLSSFFANAQSYDDELQLGGTAYRDSRYEEAIQHFRKATELDPGQLLAHLYLA